MTFAQLSAIRERLDAVPRVLRSSVFVDIEVNDLRALLDEVERLTTSLAGTEAVLENEREYQTRLKAEIGQLANESFRRGAEAMREASAQKIERDCGNAQTVANWIRDLLIPEDK
jgi:hypothetical protein